MMARGSGANQHADLPARPADRRSFTIDVGRQVTEIERVLRADGELTERVNALAILERWQFDEMLDRASRMKAKVLVQEFGRCGPDDAHRR